MLAKSYGGEARLPLSPFRSCRRLSTSDIGRAGRPAGLPGVPGRGLAPPASVVPPGVDITPKEGRGPVGRTPFADVEAADLAPAGAADAAVETGLVCCTAGDAVRAVVEAGTPFEVSHTELCFFRSAEYLKNAQYQRALEIQINATYPRPRTFRSSLLSVATSCDTKACNWAPCVWKSGKNFAIFVRTRIAFRIHM